MPNKPNHYCPRCKAIHQDYCPNRPAAKKEYDDRRGTAAERMYDSRWQKARLDWLRKHPLCRECLIFGDVVAASVVDHRRPHRGDKQLFWDRENWQSLCKLCHDHKTHRENAAMPKYVVCGPPGSGKTTWVKARAKQGDVVFDADYLMAAMYSTPLHQQVEHGAAMIERLRQAVVDWLVQYPDCTAYVIQSDVVKAKRTAQVLAAELVEIERQ